MDDSVKRLIEQNPILTISDLAQKLGMSETWIQQNMKRTSNKSHPTVDWQTYSPTSDFYRMMVLLRYMKQELQVDPFIDNGKEIVVLLGDNSALLFDLDGKLLNKGDY